MPTMDRFEAPGPRDHAPAQGECRCDEIGDQFHGSCENCGDTTCLRAGSNRERLCLGCWVIDHPHCAWGEDVPEEDGPEPGHELAWERRMSDADELRDRERDDRITW